MTIYDNDLKKYQKWLPQLKIKRSKYNEIGRRGEDTWYWKSIPFEPPSFMSPTSYLLPDWATNTLFFICMSSLCFFFFFFKIAQISNIIDYFTLISLCIMFSKSISVITNRLFMQNILTTLSNHLNEIWKNKAW